jgi:hypothetical protein
MAIESKRLWRDVDEMPVSEDRRRQIRIAELFRALADMRPARRRGDSAHFTRIEAELILLLDAELILMHLKKTQQS